MARRMVDSGTPARDISMTSALVSGLACLPVCAKAASARNRSGIARFMAEILVQFWLIRSHGDSRKYRGAGKTGGAASPRRWWADRWQQAKGDLLRIYAHA